MKDVNGTLTYDLDDWRPWLPPFPVNDGKGIKFNILLQVLLCRLPGMCCKVKVRSSSRPYVAMKANDG